MKIVADYTKCQGIGICESLVPKHFEVNDQGEMTVVGENVDDADLNLLQQAVDSCPTASLQLRP
jgi:ferredoxin